MNIWSRAWVSVGVMDAATVFDQIMALPETEQSELIQRLARETELLEDMRDVALFDQRIQETGNIPLAEILRQPKRVG